MAGVRARMLRTETVRTGIVRTLMARTAMRGVALAPLQRPRKWLAGAVLVVALAAPATAGAWSWPADGAVLRPFNMGSDPYAGGQHRGIDIGGDTGSTVRAAAAGKVSFVGTVPGSGLVVSVATADGYSVTLTHLGSASVTKGAPVEEGAPVGTIAAGSRGTAAVMPRSTRPYVHLGIRVTAAPNGYLDPLRFLPPRPGAPVARSPSLPRRHLRRNRCRRSPLHRLPRPLPLPHRHRHPLQPQLPAPPRSRRPPFGGPGAPSAPLSAPAPVADATPATAEPAATGAPAATARPAPAAPAAAGGPATGAVASRPASPGSGPSPAIARLAREVRAGRPVRPLRAPQANGLHAKRAPREWAAPEWAEHRAGSSTAAAASRARAAAHVAHGSLAPMGAPPSSSRTAGPGRAGRPTGGALVRGHRAGRVRRSSRPRTASGASGSGTPGRHPGRVGVASRGAAPAHRARGVSGRRDARRPGGGGRGDPVDPAPYNRPG